MFVPNTRAIWLKKSAKRTITGGESFEAPRTILLSIVALKSLSALTGVRADSTATRGAAEQHEAQAKFLIPPTFRVGRGDVIRLDVGLIEIVSLEARLDVFGKLDHYEVEGKIRNEP